jgi:hypothetical protein
VGEDGGRGDGSGERGEGEKGRKEMGAKKNPAVGGRELLVHYYFISRCEIRLHTL